MCRIKWKRYDFERMRTTVLILYYTVCPAGRVRANTVLILYYTVCPAGRAHVPNCNDTVHIDDTILMLYCLRTCTCQYTQKKTITNDLGHVFHPIKHTKSTCVILNFGTNTFTQCDIQLSQLHDVAVFNDVAK